MNTRLKIKILERFGTQVRFCRKAGLHESQVSRVVRGHIAPPKDERARWAKLLGCRVAEIFDGS